MVGSVLSIGWRVSQFANEQATVTFERMNGQRTTTAVSIDEYLHTVYEPDVDYVDGDLIERNAGEKDRGKVQTKLLIFFVREGLFAIPEQRIRVASTRFRVPDVCVYQSEPDEQVFTSPPLAVFEVLSQEDRLSRMVERINDYVAMGVKHIFLIDPGQKRLSLAIRPASMQSEQLK
ncbi:MAG: Uma2 family endonuclease [Bryobacteraceae bacterium]